MHILILIYLRNTHYVQSECFRVAVQYGGSVFVTIYSQFWIVNKTGTYHHWLTPWGLGIVDVFGIPPCHHWLTSRVSQYYIKISCQLNRDTPPLVDPMGVPELLASLVSPFVTTSWRQGYLYIILRIHVNKTGTCQYWMTPWGSRNCSRLRYPPPCHHWLTSRVSSYHIKGSCQ